MEALQAEIHRLEEERDSAILLAQRAREAVNELSQEATRLTAEIAELRKSLEAGNQEQAHGKEIQLLTSKHEDKSTTVVLPVRQKDARPPENDMDLSEPSEGVKRSADDAGILHEDMPDSKKARIQDDANVQMEDAPPLKKVHTTHEVKSVESSPIPTKTPEILTGHSFSSKDIPRRKKSRPARIVKCTQCIVHKQPCDSKEPCKHCVDRSVACKRTMCRHFKNGTSLNKTCAFAHEDDDFRNFIPFRKIKPLDNSAGGRKKAQKEGKSGSAYDGLFAKKKKKKKKKDGDGDGDDMDTA